MVSGTVVMGFHVAYFLQKINVEVILRRYYPNIYYRVDKNGIHS